MKHLDLFSGIGGFALAARWAEIETVQFVESDTFCQKVLKKNFPGIPVHSDIRNFRTTEKIDIITAGFPCQPFSQAGKKRGKNDERYLWNETFGIIDECSPKWIIIENVPGFIPMELDNLCADLEAENYTPETFVLPACAAFAPHRRDRLWIIAYLNSDRSNLGFSYFESGYIQKNIERHMAKIQQEWTQLIPDSWTTFENRDWFQYNRKACGRDDGLSTRLDKHRIKSLGNSIVPQLIYPVFRFIKLIN